jgi:hypothetical protein
MKNFVLLKCSCTVGESDCCFLIYSILLRDDKEERVQSFVFQTYKSRYKKIVEDDKKTWKKIDRNTSNRYIADTPPLTNRR